MILKHPADAKREDGATLFWEDKRFPEPIKPGFENTESSSYQFVYSMAVLFAEIFQIELPSDDIVNKMIEQKMSLEFSGEFASEFDKTPADMLATERIQTFKQQVKNSILNDVKLSNPIDVNDSKNHGLIVNFIHAACSLRCQNFKLPTIRRHRVEEMVYNIKPNLNASSSIAASLAVLDLLKLVSVGNDHPGHQQRHVRRAVRLLQPRSHGVSP